MFRYRGELAKIACPRIDKECDLIYCPFEHDENVLKKNAEEEKKKEEEENTVDEEEVAAYIANLEKEIGINFTKPDEFLNADLPEENGVEPENEAETEETVFR